MKKQLLLIFISFFAWQTWGQTVIPNNQINCGGCAILNGGFDTPSFTAIYTFDQPSFITTIETACQYNGGGLVGAMNMIVYFGPTSTGPWYQMANINIGTSTTMTTYSTPPINKITQYIKFVCNRTTSGCIGGCYYFNPQVIYGQPIITSSVASPLMNGACTVLTSAAIGETYQWSTGATTQTISVCNSGVYTCTVTNTSFTGNQDHVASISVSTLGQQDNLPGPNGEVYAIYKNGNNVYIGGDFNAIGPITGSGAQIDTTTAIANTNLPRVDGTINTTISDGAGGWFIGGTFTRVGNYLINNLAHINANNTVDVGFKPEPNGAVYTLKLDNAVLYIGGAFTNVKGLANNYIAKLNKINGSPVFWNANANGIVRSIDQYADQVIVGGNFTSLGGGARNYLGAVDSIFVQLNAWNPNPNAAVYKVYVNGTKLYAGGDFTTIGGVSKQYGCGFTLPAFTTDGYNMGANSRIHDFVLNNNILYAAGTFTLIGGAARNYVAGMNYLNAVANTFNATADGIVYSLAISSNKLMVGGAFSNIGGAARNRIATLSLTSGTATAWNPNVIGLKGTTSVVNSIATNSTNIYAGGYFYSVGASTRNNIASLDATTGLLTAWNPNANSIVRAIYADNTNVYLGGDFTTVNGSILKNRIAQINATTGTATGWNPNADGAVNALTAKGTTLFVGGAFANIGGGARAKIASLSTSSGGATAFNPTANGNVNALSIGGDTLYVGGAFTTIGGQTRNRVAAYGITSSALLATNPNANNTVNALSFANNKLYIAGTFTNIAAANRTYLAEYDVVGNALTSLDAYFVTSSGINVLFSSDVSLYQGGGYNFANQGQPINNLSAINTASSAVGYWQPQPDDIIRTIFAATDKVYVGGRFKTITSRYQPYFASTDLFVSSNSAPVLTSLASNTICVGDTIKVNGSGFIGVSSVNIGTTAMSFSVISSNLIKVFTTTNITGILSVTNPIGTTTISPSVTVSALPSASITAVGTTTFCQGSNTLLNANTGAGLTYLWSLNGTTISGATAATYSAIAAGIYSVSVKNAGGCSKQSNGITVTVNAAPTASISAVGSTSICQGSNSVLNANTGTGLSYQWTQNGANISGATAASYSATAAGSYAVVVTNTLNCNATSNTASVTVNTLPVVTANATSTVVCTGQSITLTGGGATTYAWSGGVTNGVSFAPTVNATYTVTGTAATGCTNTATKAITVNTLPVVTANATSSAVCLGQTTTLSGGGANTYAWSGGVTNGVAFAPTVNATYTVTGTAATGCTNTATKQITVNNLPTVTANATSTVVCSGQSITLTGGGASTYAWSGGVTNGVSFAPTVNATYTVTGTDVNGCINTATKAITVNNLPTVTANATSTVVCSGQSITLTGGGASTYAWSGGVTNGVAFAPTVNATYTVTGTAATGCTNTATKAITVNTLPVVTANATSSAVCLGQTTTLSGGGANTYAWSGGITNGVAFAPTVNATYTVTGTDVNGCINTATKAITVNNLPTVTANATSTVVCSGQSITLTGGGASTYAWSGGVTNGVSFAPTVNATYTVTGTDVNGCSSTATKAITVNNLPTVTANATSTVVCSGQAITLTGGGANTYAWSGGVTNGVSFAPTVNATYTVTGMDVNGCSNTATKPITVNNLPTVTANATSSAVCLGQTTTLSGGGATTYAWSGGVTNGVSFAPTVNATYTVTGTDVNGCINTATKAITVNNLPTVTANATSTVVCSGQSITLSGGGANTYAWSGGVTNGVSFAPTVNATYTVTGTDVNGCSSTGVQSIIVNNLPAANINTSGPTTFCSGGSVILTADASNSYLWSNGATTQSISTSQSGSYTVQVTDINGCSASSSVTSVNVNPTLVANITASGATTFCQGGSVLLTANSASTYLWSNGAITQTINVTQAGSYSVQLTSGAGCSGTSSITTIVVNPLPNVTLNSIQSPLCVNNSTVALIGNPAGGVYSGTGVSGASFNPTTAGAGTYTVSYNYTDVNTCSATASQSVEVSICTGIVAMNNESISIYPNPATTVINVKMSTALINNAIIELYDATGKLINQQQVTNEFTSLNIIELSNGIYTVRIITDNEQTIKRIIKQQ